jgi:hypothetical protein
MKSLTKILNENLHSTKDLVSFANYVLSTKRLNLLQGDKQQVYDADLANWKYYEDQQKEIQKLHETDCSD